MAAVAQRLELTESVGATREPVERRSSSSHDSATALHKGISTAPGCCNFSHRFELRVARRDTGAWGHLLRHAEFQ